jgi:Spy/CpxP family protein refolding chaperone
MYIHSTKRKPLNAMKATFSLIAMLFLGYASQAQSMKPDRDARTVEIKKIQAMEMAFITKELNLSPDEAQKFWPVFNQYRNELKGMAGERKVGDQLERQQKMLDIRKKYREDFTKVMSHERANKVFGAEEEFKSLVRREFQKRQAEKNQLEPRKKGF